MSNRSSTRPTRDATATKARILAAARQGFSTHGYAGIGIREIAELAGVSYPLIGRYYGSKAGLFDAALASFMSVDAAIAVDRSVFGENLARLIVASVANDAPLSMTILSAADSEAQPLSIRAINSRVIQPLAEWLGPPHAHERAISITMTAAGFVMFTRHMPLVSPREPDFEPLVKWMGETFQRIVDARIGWIGSPVDTIS
ncbi:MAG: TetR/AcrR family transcriptional regulator [Sphingobium sp.]